MVDPRTSLEAPPRRLRVYQGLRSAHLERSHVLEPAAIRYVSESYDLADELRLGLDVAAVRTRRDLFLEVWRGRYSELEVNEPLMLGGLVSALLAVASLRLGGRVRRHPTRVVSYAIENLDPFDTPNPRLRSRVRRRAYRAAVHLLLSQIDRLVFGTAAAMDTYASHLSAFRGERRLVPALSTACRRCADLEPTGLEVVFLGSFEERKGFPQLAAAWPEVAGQMAGARLHVLGQGPLEPLALELADREEVTLSQAPSREAIHRALRQATVVVLVSQPAATWREQVGLPIVEGLEHGCEIVATTETGLAPWLSSHGHRVLAPSAGPNVLARTILSALRDARAAADVVADLPTVDGRIGADRWMFAARS